MYGRRDDENPNWKGGITLERQAFYQSEEWKRVSQVVWKRDNATCQRCGVLADGTIEMHIHHILSFALAELRAESSNLVLLCEDCHSFIHSKTNTQMEYLANQRE